MAHDRRRWRIGEIAAVQHMALLRKVEQESHRIGDTAQREVETEAPRIGQELVWRLPGQASVESEVSGARCEEGERAAGVGEDGCFDAFNSRLVLDTRAFGK